MKIITVYSDNFLHFHKMFCNSLSREPRIQIISKKIDLSEYSSFGYQTESWYQAIKLKLQFLLENLTEQVIFSDSDIQFFNPSLLFDIVQSDLDFYGTRESTYQKRGNYRNIFNTGFFIVKNTPLVFELLERTLESLEGKRFGDQDMINKLLLHCVLRRRIPLNHAFIPTHYYAIGPYEPLDLRTCFHHATLIKKEEQLIKNYEKYFKLYYLENPKVYGDKYGEFNSSDELNKLF